jgi:hypothetical protein
MIGKRTTGELFRLGLLSALIPLFFLSPAGAQVKQEVEPNDNRAQAQEIRVGDTLEGQFQKDGDSDWYKLIVDQPGKNYLRVDLGALPDLDTYLYLYDDQGRLLVQVNDTSNGQPESIADFPVEPGAYFIRASGHGKVAPGKYRLSVKVTGPWHKGEESEPNDRRENATEIAFGESVSGHFNRRGDTDWFLLPARPEKGFVHIELSGVAGVNSRFTLRDADGRSIWVIDDNREGGSESLAHHTVGPAASYIEIYGNERNTETGYAFSVKVEGPWQDGWEFEPNDRKEGATELQLGQSVQGYFQRRGDYDYFRLTIDQPGKNLIQVDLTAVPEVGTRMELLSAEGKQIWRADDRGKGEPESIFPLPVSPGTYYLSIYGDAKNITDKYTLSPKLVGPWREGMESEPNDVAESADEISFGQTCQARINKKYDQDYYKLVINEPGQDLAVFEISGVQEVRWNLQFLDAQEKRLNQAASGQPGEGEEIVKMRLKPGTYYLRTSLAGGQNIGTEYSLYVGKPRRPPATAEEVQLALMKALDYLASTQRKDGSWERYEQAYTGLSIMAFVGGKCVQKDYSANVKAALDFLKSKYTPSSKYPQGSREADHRGGSFGTQEMYQHAIATLAVIEALVDLNDESLEPIAREAVQLILRSQNTEHKPETLKGPIQPDSRAYGGWRYSPDSTDSDISLTGWQVLTLKAAVNAGFTVPDYVFPAAAGFVRSLQGKNDGSFRYDSPGDAGSSCARAGMGALSLQLSGYPQDPMIPPAIRFMQDYPPRWNVEEPGNGYPFYYWYYGTRAMYLAGGDDWRIWKDWMCRFLVDHQNEDGSWDGAQSEQSLHVYRAALGALMLEFCCGHVPIYMSPVKRLGSGTIKVEFEKGAEKEASKNVEIIMDASNSMWGQIAGEAKITIARKVLTQIINGLPESMNVGLRAYGHRYGLNDRGACTDTELLVPIGPLAKARLVDTVNKIQLKGKTPLVLSVLEAIKDFEKIPNGSVILVTDGIESCNGDIQSIAPAIKKSGLELKVHIVGFDIKEKESREQLEAIAKSTDGRYLDAKNAGELLSALEQTLQVEYVVLNEKGEEAGRGVVGGEAVKVKEGTYTLRILLAPQPLEAKIVVKADSQSVCVLKKEAGAWKLGC